MNYADTVVAAPTGLIMLPAAGGASYEQFKENGWTDEAMIARGFMAAPQPVDKMGETELRSFVNLLARSVA